MAIGGPRNGRSVMSEINVTPFVDVMLVLLVIFMVTAPILYHGVEVKLPKVESRPVPAAESAEKLVIRLDAKGRISLDGKIVPLNKLKVRIRSALKARGKDAASEHVFLMADRSVPYGEVVKVMAEVKKAGVQKLGLITEPQEPRRVGRRGL